MGKVGKIAIVAALAAAVGAVVAVKYGAPACATRPAAPAGASAGLPRLVDFGGSTCIPCQMMMPALEELKTEYAGRLQVEVVDVWDDPEIGRKHDIRVIPTQIFYDASGKELDRHEGYMSKQDILARWAQLGVDLAAEAGGERGR